MMPEDNSLRINKNNGLTNKYKKKDKEPNNKNINNNSSHNKLKNLTE